jgi:hypothetical protein
MYIAEIIQIYDSTNSRTETRQQNNNLRRRTVDRTVVAAAVLTVHAPPAIVFLHPRVGLDLMNNLLIIIIDFIYILSPSLPVLVTFVVPQSIVVKYLAVCTKPATKERFTNYRSS